MIFFSFKLTFQNLIKKLKVHFNFKKQALRVTSLLRHSGERGHRLRGQSAEVTGGTAAWDMCSRMRILS